MQFIANDQIEVTYRGDGYMVGESKIHNDMFGENELCGSFEGVSAFIDFLKKNMPDAKQSKSSDAPKDGDSFYFFQNYKEAMDVYTNTPSQVREFTESEVQLRNGDSSGIDVQYGVTGEYLDVSRYLEGEPECFGSMTNGNPRGFRVNLIIDIGWVSHVQASDIVLRGQRIQRLVDWLEAQQVRTSILCATSRNTDHIEIKVKDHDESLDLNDLAVVSHSDFLRRLDFRFAEYSQTWSHGYGNPRVLREHLYYNSPLPEVTNEINIVIGNNNNSIDSEFDHAEGWITETLTELPIEAKDRFLSIL